MGFATNGAFIVWSSHKFLEGFNMAVKNVACVVICESRVIQNSRYNFKNSQNFGLKNRRK